MRSALPEERRGNSAPDTFKVASRTPVQSAQKGSSYSHSSGNKKKKKEKIIIAGLQLAASEEDPVSGLPRRRGRPHGLHVRLLLRQESDCHSQSRPHSVSLSPTASKRPRHLEVAAGAAGSDIKTGERQTGGSSPHADPKRSGPAGEELVRHAGLQRKEKHLLGLNYLQFAGTSGTSGENTGHM